MADPSTSTSKKRLALAIVDFLQTSQKDGTIPAEEAESIDVAVSCIVSAFNLTLDDSAAMTDAIGTQSLLQIYGVFEKLKGKGLNAASVPKADKPSSSSPGDANPETAGPNNVKAKEEAETLKAQGNAAMQKKDYNLAIDQYTRALALQPLNPIYLSNRAAAYSGARMHDEAKSDAEMAVAADPKYTKAWSRLGLAKYALGDAKGSLEAYQKGIEAEGNGGSEAMKRGYETAKKRVEEEGGLVDEDEDDIGAPDATRAAGAGPGGMPDLSSLAGMFGGGGAGGQGGGMPDFSALMNNPMMRQMAENIMSDPEALNNIMQNPQLRDMAGRFGGGGRGGGGGGGASGGGMPDLSSLMNDPNIADMARNFMGGGAGRGGAGAGRGT